MAHPDQTGCSGYVFRQVVKEDLAMLDIWLRTPEVVRWWGKPEEQARLLEEDLNEPGMTMRIVSFHGRPFAYAQHYAVHTWPQPHFECLPQGREGNRCIHWRSRHGWQGPWLGLLAAFSRAVDRRGGSAGCYRSPRPQCPCASRLRKSRLPQRERSHDRRGPCDADDLPASAVRFR